MNNKYIESTLDNFAIKGNTKIDTLRETEYNSVFKIQGDREYALRIGKRATANGVRFETELLRFLYNKDFPVPQIFPDTAGNDYHIMGNNYIATLFEFVSGSHFDVESRDRGEEAIFNAGATLGELHSLTIDYVPETEKDRSVFSEVNRVLDQKDLITSRFTNGDVFIQDVEDMIGFAQDEDENEKQKKGVINNDYRPGNVLFDENNQVKAVIDFDWACSGPLVKDLALALVEWSFPDGKELRMDDLEVFLKGYNSSAPVKHQMDDNLRRWIMFACISDACTYIADRITDGRLTQDEIRSYMYDKYLFFKKQLSS